MKKNRINVVIEDSTEILREYSLCDYCLGRMFATRLHLISHKKLGAKIRKIIDQSAPKSCFICKTLMQQIDFFLGKIFDISKDYEFSTFLVGSILQPSILDRDDLIRSKLKLRGIASIKSDITREIGKRFGRRTGTKVDYNNPDLVFTIDFKKENIEIKPKALVLQGRYTKTMRGIPQKQKSCEVCSGKGCYACEFHGISEFNSVEGKMAQFLFEKFGAQQAKITWIGSEDESSLVLGKGRPFFIKLTNPHKRNISLSKKISLDGVSILDLRIIPKIPTEIIKFRTEVLLDVETEREVGPEALKVLGCLKDASVSVNENLEWKSQKKIYDVKIKKIDSKAFTILLKLDGGIPLKRFVSGSNIEPNMSVLLENTCKCKTFDFLKISVTN